jgi:hypothetical protein
MHSPYGKWLSEIYSWVCIIKNWQSNVIKHGADKGEGEDTYFWLIRNHIGPVNIVIITLLCPDGKKKQ